MKKSITLVLALAMVLVFAFAGCSAPQESPSVSESAAPSESASASESAPADESPATAVKIGVILVHDENTGYDFAHMDGIRKAVANVGFSEDQIVWKYNIAEDETCYDTATDLVEQGCAYIISDSFNHQSYMQQAAEENPDVVFIAMTGVNAAPSGLANMKNAFNKTFESRYVSGVVAGMKLAELVTDGKVADKNKDKDGNIKIGYVGAYPYDEVVSGYT